MQADQEARREAVEQTLDLSARNQQRMSHALAGLAVGDSTAFVALLSDEVTWTMHGATSWSGTHRGKPAVLAMFRALAAQLSRRYHLHTTRVIAQGDVVVVEAQGDNPLPDGRRYDNTYCWVCTFERDQVTAVTEHMDTDLVLRVLTPFTPATT